MPRNKASHGVGVRPFYELILYRGAVKLARVLFRKGFSKLAGLRSFCGACDGSAVAVNKSSAKRLLRYSCIFGGVFFQTGIQVMRWLYEFLRGFA